MHVARVEHQVEHRGLLADQVKTSPFTGGLSMTALTSLIVTCLQQPQFLCALFFWHESATSPCPSGTSSYLIDSKNLFELALPHPRAYA